MQFNVRGFVALVSEEEVIEIELNTFLRCYKMSIEVELDSVEKRVKSADWPVTPRELIRKRGARRSDGWRLQG